MLESTNCRYRYTCHTCVFQKKNKKKQNKQTKKNIQTLAALQYEGKTIHKPMHDKNYMRRTSAEDVCITGYSHSSRIDTWVEKCVM